MSERYILNSKKTVYHDKERLTERCNTDQIPNKKYVSKEEVREMTGKRLLYACAYCKPNIWHPNA